MELESLASEIVTGVGSGFGIVGSFATMIKNAFKGLFITETVSGSTTTYSLSTFAVVALVMIGVSIVTGLGMLIFRRFFSRT